jgi:hypothetical protein
MAQHASEGRIELEGNCEDLYAIAAKDRAQDGTRWRPCANRQPWS